MVTDYMAVSGRKGTPTAESPGPIRRAAGRPVKSEQPLWQANGGKRMKCDWFSNCFHSPAPHSFAKKGVSGQTQKMAHHGIRYRSAPPEAAQAKRVNSDGCPG
jgi:hypothetical protein